MIRSLPRPATGSTIRSAGRLLSSPERVIVLLLAGFLAWSLPRDERLHDLYHRIAATHAYAIAVTVDNRLPFPVEISPILDVHLASGAGAGRARTGLPPAARLRLEGASANGEKLPHFLRIGPESRQAFVATFDTGPFASLLDEKSTTAVFVLHSGRARNAFSIEVPFEKRRLRRLELTYSVTTPTGREETMQDLAGRGHRSLPGTR